MMLTPSDSADRRSAAFQVAESWFANRGWHVFDFQRNVWQAYLDGQSGLIHAPTGTGKTLAAWWGPLLAWLADAPASLATAAQQPLRSLLLKACVSCGLRRCAPWPPTASSHCLPRFES